MTTPTPWGKPFGVSTTTDDQGYMKTAAFADGSFVAVWLDDSKTGPDTSGLAIRGQIFNADGSKRGGEFVVNTTTENEQRDPVVTVLSDGRFVVAWTDDSRLEDGSETGVRARIFNADGTAFNRGGDAGDTDFLVNTTSKTGAQLTPSIAALANGGFVIAFEDEGPATDVIKAHVFDAQGFHTGGEVLVKSETGDSQSAPSVVASGNSYTVFYQTSVEGVSSIYGRSLYTDGREPSAESLISMTELGSVLPKTAKLSDGRFVVTWLSLTEDEVSGDYRYLNTAQMFNADGSKSGGEIILKGSDTPIEIVTNVTALSNGGFAVLFVSGAEEIFSETGKFDVGAIFYDANGNKTGANPQITQVKLEHYMTIGISTLADGRVVVTSTLLDGENMDDMNVYGQIVDGRAAGISLPGTAGNDEYYGTAFGDHLNGAAGNDKLVGGDGNDTLIGGAGRDTLDGGAGDDTYTYDAEDVIIDAGGIDTLIVSSHYTLSSTSALENLIASGSAAIKLSGNNAANKLTGSTGADTLTGNGGNDTLDGAGGADRMVGGTGNDVYYVNHKSDKVVETSSKHGTDTVYARISYTLGSYVEKLIGEGSSAISLTGNASSNTIIGNLAKNTIKGQGGNDVIDGGLGNDVLYGGTGKDAFVFSTALHKSKNVDTIKDFSVRDDTIRLENAIFTKLTKTGKLNKAFFKIGDKAKDKNDYLVYNSKTGALSYDADGSGKGAAIKIAQLPKGLAMTAADFIVI
ncbi:calcium-binding protein [Microvirga sp. ACRRW]|uniref:calcium-binding protein n=1 Tax=Microvirga sp. ACRRW TaxID=2918205 RepID=UPI001EF61949|nr:calcium-binding protein [Microvirga sp. ACRRW]MCG7392385.1 calcium-binding protein [Microvirga sp. ACRRW]